ncbi:MAG: GlsB/YeaQ/YmgE family stress response membrane protein [Deltaproteobacteria bacterium]|nr:GlsB/YeaQ/YmgE family stress response membrane protein [Deltaproteobacteria bacterium]
MGILSWVVLGLIAGVLAKLIMPGKDPGGMIITIAIGIAGAFVGGFVSSLLGFGSVTGFDFRSIVVAVAGAILLLLGYRLIKKEK